MPDQRVDEIARCETLLNDLQTHYQQCGQPPGAEDVKTALFSAWTSVTFEWLHDFREASFDANILPSLSDRWIDTFAIVDPEFDMWTEVCFKEWGQNELGEAIAQFEDGEAESLADEAFLHLFSEMPLFEHDLTCTKLKARIQALLHTDPDVPHRSVYIPPDRVATQVTDEIPMHYEEQQAWHDRLRSVRWDRMIDVHKVPRLLQQATPHFVVVHLFSGRRRDKDVHYWLAQWAQIRGLRITILSMDTAVSETYGNLCVNALSWAHLIELYQQGAISATLAGAPCETYSAARHLPAPEGIDGSRWPRPLRSHARLWGLAHLTWKELRQCRQGTSFSLQTLYIAALHVAFGGVFLSEHPACPEDPELASIWRSAIVEILRALPGCTLQTFPQWKWGSLTPKPTGLLSIGLPSLARSMYDCMDESLQYPQRVAQGIGADGRFRTADCKEYPPLFCKALAKGITDRFDQALRQHEIREVSVESEALQQWIQEAAQASAAVYSFSTIRPDYQGR
eukprot:s65_g35.t1